MLSREVELVEINSGQLVKLNSTFFHRQRKEPSFLTVKSEGRRENPALLYYSARKWAVYYTF